jgi:hypothetical membrane protein
MRNRSPTQKIIPDTYRLGLVLWALIVQYYIVQAIAAGAWKAPFSIAHNTISDLGNTACGAYGTRYVCSPLHGVMNGSFVVLGLLMAAGAFAVYKALPKTWASRIGLGCIAVAGLGSMLVGFFPENTVSALHILGAALSFSVGNIGLVILSFVPGIPKPLRLYAAVSGLIAMLALAAFLSHSYFRLGIGGMERIVAYPQSIWLIIFSVAQLLRTSNGRKSGS